MFRESQAAESQEVPAAPDLPGGSERPGPSRKVARESEMAGRIGNHPGDREATEGLEQEVPTGEVAWDINLKEAREVRGKRSNNRLYGGYRADPLPLGPLVFPRSPSFEAPGNLTA